MKLFVRSLEGIQELTKMSQSYDVFLGEIPASNFPYKTRGNIFIEKEIQIWLFHKCFGHIVPASSYTGRDVHSHVISCCSQGRRKEKGGGHVPQFLADQLTLSQPGGQDYSHCISTGTPGFLDLPTALD